MQPDGDSEPKCRKRTAAATDLGAIKTVFRESLFESFK